MSDNNLVISVDAMGGDNSPHVVVEGIAIAHKSNPDIKFLLFGDEVQIEENIKKFPQLRSFCKVIHTSERVRNEDKPSQVIRNKNTSMYMAIDAVRRGEASAVISAGNTGALMAISKMILKNDKVDKSIMTVFEAFDYLEIVGIGFIQKISHTIIIVQEIIMEKAR